MITVDGVPAARIGPLDDGHPRRDLDDLIAAGQVLAPRTTAPPARPNPVPAPSGESSNEILRRDRER